MDNNRHGNGYLDNDPYYNGQNAGSLASFLMIRDVKYYWIAFFALWAYWGLLWFLRHVFGDGHMAADYAPPADREAAVTGAEGDQAEQQQQPRAGVITRMRGWVRKPHVSRTHSRLSRASDVLRDLVLLLLSVLVLNTLGRGSTHTVMILAWVFFGFAVVWSIFEASYESHVARFIYGAIFYGIALAIGALAFKHGFHEFH
ncbi:hypothetical protein BJV82DRAFT_557183 [Fennellomyces sp. T-0311]|nr:hypothetical protein BJV82DRAFT_557183 [Fennellomyces sp. T-0311]